MKKIDRYLATTVISTILLVVLMLLGVQMFIEFTHEFGDIGTANYGIWHALCYVILLLPQDIYQFFPMAGLLGTLIGLGLLASRSELIVMRAAGISLVRIASIVIKAAFLVMLLAIFLGEVIGPYAQHTATLLKTRAISGGQTLHTRHGTWVRNGNDFIHIAAVLPRDKLQNITRYQLDANNKLRAISFAKKGVYSAGSWHFKDIAVSTFLPQRITSQKIAEQDWGFKFKPKLLRLSNIDSEQKTLPELYSYIKYKHHSGMRAIQYEFDFWHRVFRPLATLVMILLALPFIFGPLRSVTMGSRIVVGTVVGFAFYILNQFIGPIAEVYQLQPVLAASLPTLLVALLGLILLLRVG